MIKIIIERNLLLIHNILKELFKISNMRVNESSLKVILMVKIKISKKISIKTQT